MEKPTVAVIGAGPVGLAALKCLLEEGFLATAFDSRDDVGGVWYHYPGQEETTSLQDTLLNSSRYVSHYSDFPFPEDYPTYPSASLMHKYFKLYAESFKLYDHIKLNSKVVEIKRAEENQSWLVTVQSTIDGSTKTLTFDKLIVSNGMVHTPIMPSIEGSDMFKGTIIHGQAFKTAKPFTGRNVVVLGIGNTAADIAVDLSHSASSVYLSHRRGAYVFSRFRQGLPIELGVNQQVLRVLRWLEDKAPRAYGKIIDLVAGGTMKKTWEIDPSWNLAPAPSMFTTLPCVNEELIPQLAAGKITSVRGIRRFVGPKALELDDGRILEDIDAVILATGYKSDLSVTPWLDTVTPSSAYAGPPMPNLYLQVFPPQYADSVAFLNVLSALDCIWVVGELASMAVAQLWSGQAAFPSQQEMQQSVAAQAEASAARWRLDGSATPGHVRAAEFYGFMHAAAGTGVYEVLSWGLRGWRFWWRERGMSRLMGWGVATPFMYRLVETGKRKAWNGAGEAIKKANADAKGLDPTVRKFKLDEAQEKKDDSESM